MNIDQVVEIIQQKWYELQKSNNLNFRDYLNDNWRPKHGRLEFQGVYVVYKGKAPIYVGSAGKGTHVLKWRISDMFYCPNAEKNNFYHTLTRKLVKKYLAEEHGVSHGIEEAINAVRTFYLRKCSFKVVQAKNMDEARMLEQAFILLLKPRPKYNSK
jgi:hypothetical protein